KKAEIFAVQVHQRENQILSRREVTDCVQLVAVSVELMIMQQHEAEFCFKLVLLYVGVKIGEEGMAGRLFEYKSPPKQLGNRRRGAGFPTADAALDRHPHDDNYMARLLAWESVRAKFGTSP